MSILKIIAPLPSVSKRTRLNKIVENNFIFSRVKFYGWQRSSEELLDPNSKIILKGGGYSSKKARLLYIIWIIKVFILCLGFKRSDVVWSLGFESAFPAILASKIKGFKVIYDDADRFSSLFNFPKILKKILVKLEIYSSFNCYVHVIPGLERYEFKSPKFFVLKNTPTSKDINSAQDFNLSEKIKIQLESYKFTIYVNGWLGEGRGLRIIHNVAKQLPNVAFLLAGRIDSTYAKDMLLFNNVLYLGELPQYQALAYYRVSNLVFTYYDPKLPINRMAEANKWGDALQFQIPVIVNSEVITAQYLREEKACISFPYEDIEALVASLKILLENPKEYKELVESIQKIQTKFPTFDLQLINLFKNLE